MPQAHGDCKFHDEWLVQDKYKEWVMKDGDPRLARCKFCMKSSMQEMPTPKLIICSWSGAFEEIRVGVGTCACVIHVLSMSLS